MASPFYDKYLKSIEPVKRKFSKFLFRRTDGSYLRRDICNDIQPRELDYTLLSVEGLIIAVTEAL